MNFLERTGAAKGLRVPENFSIRGAVVQPFSLQIENRDQVRDIVRDQPQEFFALAQFRLRLFLFQRDLDR